MPFLLNMYCHGVRSLLLLVTSALEQPDKTPGPTYPMPA